MWRSCSSKESAAWLLSIPWPRKGKQNLANTNLSDENFKVAAQYRLYHRITPLPPGMVPEAFKCKLCGKQLDEYGGHAWSCKHMGNHRTWIHTGISRTVLYETKLARDVQSILEANIVDCGFKVKPGVVGDLSGSRMDVGINTNPRGLRDPSSMLVVDVTVTGPLTQISTNEGGLVVRTNAGIVTSGDGQKQGAAADRAVKRKNKKYLERFDISKEQFFPFAMETSGLMHRRALDFVGAVARLQSDYFQKQDPVGRARQRFSIGARFRHIIERVAVTQQSGFSRMLLNYQQKCIPR
jgi:hypothetical protein